MQTPNQPSSFENLPIGQMPDELADQLAKTVMEKVSPAILGFMSAHASDDAILAGVELFNKGQPELSGPVDLEIQRFGPNVTVEILYDLKGNVRLQFDPKFNRKTSNEAPSVFIVGPDKEGKIPSYGPLANKVSELFSQVKDENDKLKGDLN
ncbi:MAG: hypothetical protein WCT53_04610 [Candidatus Gracilibacteria bacterium]